jgi:hypothetical protein
MNLSAFIVVSLQSQKFVKTRFDRTQGFVKEQIEMLRVCLQDCRRVKLSPVGHGCGLSHLTLPFQY